MLSTIVKAVVFIASLYIHFPFFSLFLTLRKLPIENEWTDVCMCPYRKRFDRAEAEYITAKLDLQRKTETKEQLTEHLCTIIQQNELRKAKKLEELMQQLDVQADEEALELEVEVEQLLREQETETGKQVVPVESPGQPAGESVSSGLADGNKEPQLQTTSPEANKPGKHSSSPPLRLDCPGQGAKNFSAAVAT